MPEMPASVRVCEPNTRDALRKVRAQLGADALILSTRRTGAGIEVLALAPHALERLTGDAPAPRAQAPAPDVLAELRAISGRITEQLGQMAWRESVAARPARAALARSLAQAGFGETLARQVSQGLPDDFGAAQTQAWLRAVLARNLCCAGEDADLVARGGAYALVGPAGVGETTTIAKLAARCVVKHGARSLGLVTMDSYRIGAFDQLRIYGRILGVPVHAANDEAELGAALGSLAGKHLVLIDTVGIGQRDARMREQLACLAQPSVKQMLVLSAAGQPEALEEAAAAFRSDGLAGAVLTKIDEAVKLGGALDVLIRHRLSLMGVANGQRVPEDLHAANAGYLVERALRAAKNGAHG